MTELFQPLRCSAWLRGACALCKTLDHFSCSLSLAVDAPVMLSAVLLTTMTCKRPRSGGRTRVEQTAHNRPTGSFSAANLCLLMYSLPHIDLRSAFNSSGSKCAPEG